MNIVIIVSVIFACVIVLGIYCRHLSKLKKKFKKRNVIQKKDFT